jgi:Integrase core domain
MANDTSLRLALALVLYSAVKDGACSLPGNLANRPERFGVLDPLHRPVRFSTRFLTWCVAQQIALMHIEPSKPVQNAHLESFHGRLREECLTLLYVDEPIELLPEEVEDSDELDPEEFTLRRRRWPT